MTTIKLDPAINQGLLEKICNKLGAVIEHDTNSQNFDDLVMRPHPQKMGEHTADLFAVEHAARFVA